MDPSGHLIAVAIDDDDTVWYEMLIPFLLSLRQTDYRGHVAVLGYGLSDRKKDILAHNSIALLDALPLRTSTLSYQRYLDIVRLIQINPGIKKAALYDADIWFQNGRHDLFNLLNNDEIHVCLDAVFSTFVTAALHKSSESSMEHMVTEGIISRYGNALQAGLVAGTATAWLEFSEFLHSCITRIGSDFVDSYGIDTTFLHIWAYERKVCIVPSVQNYIPKLGVIENFGYYNPEQAFLSQNGPIRALHMCRDVRYLNRWRYYALNPSTALSAGVKLQLSDDARMIPRHLSQGAIGALRKGGFEIVDILVEPNGTFEVTGAPGEIIIYSKGNHIIQLRAPECTEFFEIVASHHSGYASPPIMDIQVGQNLIRRMPDLSSTFRVKLIAGEIVTLRSTGLLGQLCRSNWIIEHYRVSDDA